ncbi:MAG: hypothetical protein PHG85_07030 [Candidatus Altiarchaeota archaeon]|nr:hypothetical protein [Candidatus Altiarchaeota archaeon]
MGRRVLALPLLIAFLITLSSVGAIPSIPSLPDMYSPDNPPSSSMAPSDFTFPSFPRPSLTRPEEYTTTIPLESSEQTELTSNKATSTLTAPTSYSPITTRPASRTTTTLTTTARSCGGDSEVCYIELDITGDGVPECCNERNNPACSLCLKSCKKMCNLKNEGVKYCFGSDAAFSCECTPDEAPTCYQVTTPSTKPAVVNETGPLIDRHSPLFYIIILVILFAALAFVIYYARKV